MNMIEKWRVDELSLVLKRISEILQACGEAEWAGVFRHYQAESRALADSPPVDGDHALPLVRSLRSCLKEAGSLRDPGLVSEGQGEVLDHRREYHKARGRLLGILEELEERLRESIS